jgi:hypothetical protein
MGSTEKKVEALWIAVKAHDKIMGNIVAAQFEMLQVLVERVGIEHLPPNLRKFYDGGVAALAQHEREQKG